MTNGKHETNTKKQEGTTTRTITNIKIEQMKNEKTNNHIPQYT